MRYLVAVIYVVVCFFDGLSGQEKQFHPYDEGSFNTTSIYERRLTSIGLAHNLNVYSPVEAGNYPIIYHFTGLALVIPGRTYSELLTRIASHGYVVVAMRRILGPLSYLERYPFIQDTVDWCTKHLESELIKNGGASPDLTINFNLSFGLAHSSGSHVLIDYLSHTPSCGGFKGIAMMSPVDGPFVFCTSESEPLNFDIPTLILTAGLDNDPGNRSQPCAPDEYSDARFYNAVNPSSPKWMINATEMGHVDFMDEEMIASIKVTDFCLTNHDATPEDYKTYQSFVAGQVLSFLTGLIADANCNQYFDLLEDTIFMPVIATSVYENPYPGCFNPYCNWAPPPSTTTVATTLVTESAP